MIDIGRPIYKSYPTDVAKEYLKILKSNEEYDVYYIDFDFSIKKGVGIIHLNNSYNHHNNYDDSEMSLYIIDKVNNSKNHIEKWWSLSFEVVKEIQIKLVEDKVAELNNAIEKLNSLKGIVK
jgi:hypothetical protein